MLLKQSVSGSKTKHSYALHICLPLRWIFSFALRLESTVSLGFCAPCLHYSLGIDTMPYCHVCVRVRVRAGYYYEGFLAIQRAADLSIISELGGASVQPTLTNVDVRLKSFPYPPYHHDGLAGILQHILVSLLMFSLAFLGFTIVGDVAREKEKKLKAGVLSLE